jgi:L-amino acid N-acyltransferase
MPRPIATVRPATAADLDAINDIYNYYVLNSTCTYQELPEPGESRQEWYRHHTDNHPVVVAEVNGQVVGWAPFRPTGFLRQELPHYLVA